MSAFVVRTETINAIVAFLFDAGTYHQPLRRLEVFPPADVKSPAGLGRAFYDMNVKAVRQRYGERADEMSAIGYHYRAVAAPDPIVALKMLDCLRYQCTEGDVPETELYRALTAAIAETGCAIARGLPEYEKAPWG